MNILTMVLVEIPDSGTLSTDREDKYTYIAFLSPLYQESPILEVEIKIGKWDNYLPIHLEGLIFDDYAEAKAFAYSKVKR